MELAGTGIHVILIEPGPILSHFRDNSYAAYKRHIDWQHSLHRTSYETMEKRLLTEGAVVPFTLPPEAVLKRVIRAFESPRPKPRYFVTFPTYLFAFMKRVLPDRLLDYVLSKV